MVRPHTGRYIPVRQLTGTWTTRYWAIPPKSTVGGRFRLSAVNFGRRRSISAIDGRLREKEEEGDTWFLACCSSSVSPRDPSPTGDSFSPRR
ncbi:hypothetical protein GW17_00049075 [Ensete ventricosum]|uniref:Uncharacterized protein n=1 Tax=Ensete ventricosum TaxID=4639 RepID=A0A426XWE7_ENSVE|nr:hypothetical protein B296_00056124 [Ensete ventricosum]RWV88808.1 hypothetical protein GW17_00049075 [Ensete ventricosum]